MTTADLEQRRRTVRVLELLDKSFAAHTRGDHAASDTALSEAAALDVNVMSVIQGGIIIGEVPNPETHPEAWADYVDAAREALANAESLKGGDDGVQAGP